MSTRIVPIHIINKEDCFCFNFTARQVSKCLRNLRPGAPEVGYLAQHQLLDQVNRMTILGTDWAWVIHWKGDQCILSLCHTKVQTFDECVFGFKFRRVDAGCHKGCRLSWLTNSALVYEPNDRDPRGSCGISASECSCAHGAQINFGDLTPYLTYG
jgi:hypothetical protein